MKEKGIEADPEFVTRVAALIKERATFVSDFWDIAWYLFKAPSEYVEKDAAKFWKPENSVPAQKVASFIEDFNGPWTKDALEPALEEFIRGNEWPMGKVMNCLRLALTGCGSGLGIADIVIFIGKDELARRMEKACKTLG